MAKYLVVKEPGVPVPGRGFYKPGETLVLADDAMPSRFFHPLDEAAVAALKRAKEAYLADYERRIAKSRFPRELSIGEKEAILHIHPLPEANKGLQLKKKSEETFDDTLTPREMAEGKAPGTRSSASKRAADR